MKRKPLIAVIVVVILLAAGLYAWSEFNRETGDLGGESADVVISAGELIAAFEQNADSASKHFIDKTVEVTGQVKGIDTSGVLSLGVSGSMSSVQCSMDEKNELAYESLQEGQALRIKGKCTGYQSDDLLGTDVKMNFCVLSENE